MKVILPTQMKTQLQLGTRLHLLLIFLRPGQRDFVFYSPQMYDLNQNYSFYHWTLNDHLSPVQTEKH